LIISRAPPPFFGGLEDQVHRAVEIAVPREVLRRRQQHGGVAVVAAGVHLAGDGAGVREGVELGHRQRIHVGAQADRSSMLRGRFAAVPAVHDADHAGRSQPSVDRYAPFGELGGHQIGGAHLLEAQLGMSVDVAPQLSQGRGLCQDGFDQLHGGSLALPACLCHAGKEHRAETPGAADVPLPSPHAC